MALTLVERVAAVAAARPMKPRRSRSGGFVISCLPSPRSARTRTPGHDPARDHEPEETDNGPDEPRIDAVRGPNSSAHPCGAAQHAEQDGCDPRPEERVRDQ